MSIADEIPNVDDEPAELLEKWQRGDQSAATALYRRYAERLIALAASRLPANLSHRIEPEDAVQSAFRCFFADSREGRFRLKASDDLWQLLAVITLCKVRNQMRDAHREKRDVGRERSLDAETASADVQESLVTHEPSPAEALALIDEVQEAMRRLGPREQRVLELRLSGHAVSDIAAELRISSATVDRTLRRIKQQLQQWFAERNLE